MTPHLADTPILQSERLTLRAPVPADYPAWESFFLSDRAIYIGGGPDFDEGRAWRSFASILGHWAIRGFGVFALVRKDTGAVVGGCGPWFPALWPEHEVGWTIWDPSAEGKGFMAEAAKTVIRHAYDDLGWHTAVSYIATENARSIALAERLGAALDANAKAPGEDTLVYRHPGPGPAK